MTRSRCLIRIAFMVWVAAAVGPVHAEIYRWVDGDGVTHFSDEPHAGAEKLGNVQVPVIQSQAPAVPANSVARDESHQSSAPYQSIVIQQPAPEATVRNNPGQVKVALAIRPGLRAGDRIELDLDGKPVPGSPFRDTGVTLQDINRGAHTLTARIVDSQGKTIIESNPVTFYMHRPSVNLPARQK